MSKPLQSNLKFVGKTKAHQLERLSDSQEHLDEKIEPICTGIEAATKVIPNGLLGSTSPERW